MLTRTFIHLPGVGRATERAIWDAGIADWDDFLAASELPPRIDGSRERLQALARRARDEYRAGNAAYFAKILPPREIWRLYADFRGNAAFLDIETTGLSAERGVITMIGALDADGYTAYTRGENIADFRHAAERCDLVVTYNGASFDLPFIERHFGTMFKHAAHIDLRFPLRRVGFRGGLKAIETQAGVGRPSALGVLDGYDAVLLWQLCERGAAGARETLARYNAEDVASLPALAEIAYNRLGARLFGCGRRFPELQPSHRHNIRIPYDVGVIERVKAMRSGL